MVGHAKYVNQHAEDSPKFDDLIMCAHCQMQKESVPS